jgi:hypothetical protein
MSYTSVESAAITVLRKHTDYNTTNVSSGDYRILATGISQAVIFTPGAILERSVATAPRRVRTLWLINMELFLPFTDEISTIATAIRAERNTVIDHMDTYPTLDGESGVIHAFVTGGANPESWRGENRRWWKQTLKLEVEERANVTIAE